MIHGETHHGTAEHGTPAHPFSDAEWQSFRQSDMAAGRNIIILMTGIFVIGVILYAIIDLICAA
jgi:hypothetical protein